jgi:TIR domain
VIRSSLTFTSATSKTVHGSCGISVDGLIIGQVHFQLQLSNGGHSQARRISRTAVIKSAFASYAVRDRRRVLARIQGVEQLGVSVFADVNGLRGNEQSKKQIFQVISDILYLFWSKHAKRSTWIEQEWRYGMEKKGRGFIDLVPLVDPNKAPPPLELADQRLFRCRTATNSDGGKSLSLWEKVRSWLGN